MPLSLEEISDRMEIYDTLVRYSYGLDHRRWEEWDAAFLPDAVLDFSAVGLARHSPAELREIFSRSDATRISGQHLLSNIRIRLDGDTAATHAEYSLVTLARTDRPGRARRITGGGWYEDDLVRTAVGWRIRNRRAFSTSIHTDEIDWKDR
jgi:3-phenylpropionate/cinnamic acid dioxygenase small subunit